MPAGGWQNTPVLYYWWKPVRGGGERDSDVIISQPSQRKPLETTRATQRGRASRTDDPCSTMRVRRAQGKPRPSRMSKMLLPMELDTAMSPIPERRPFTNEASLPKWPPTGNTSILLPLKARTKNRKLLYLYTLSRHNQTRHAVRNAGARCQEGDTHDVVRDVQRVTDDGDLWQEKCSNMYDTNLHSYFQMAHPAQCWPVIYY